MTDTLLYHAEAAVIVGAIAVLALHRLMLALDGRGHTASLRAPVAAGLGVRLAAIAVGAAVPAIGHKLATTDEAAYVASTRALAALPITSGKWLAVAVHWTEIMPWALTYKLLGACGTLPLRLEQIALNLAAVIVVAAAAGRIGGRRAALYTAWIAALEPSSAFFGGLLAKESLCLLGEALLVGALVDAWIADAGWRKPVLAAVVGLALIFGTRSYLAFFAGVGALLTLVALVLCERVGLARGIATVSGAALLAALAGIFAAPHVVPGTLANLQYQLDYRYPGADLPLPPAAVTNAGGLLSTAFSRSVDLLVRPFPWQTADAAQKAAVAGTIVWYALLLAALWLIVRRGLDGRLVPALALLACETVGFGLTLVDSGEGFRHRVNLVLLVALVLGVMLARGRRRAAASWRQGVLIR